MKKNGNVWIVCVVVALFMLLTWFVNSGSFSSGAYVSNGLTPIGIFDLFVLVFYVLNYKAMEVVYLLMIGGTYGVLSKTAGYQKIIDKSVKVVKGNEWIAMLLITLVMGVFASISNDLLVVFGIVPFIVTVFLRCGMDRLTALSAAFGGVFIGFIGQTFGTYGDSNLLSALNLTVKSNILYEIIVFVVTYILFNVFAISHMKKIGIVNETKYDMFMTPKLNEQKVNPKNRKKVWPLVILFGISLLIGILAFISWETSFGVTIFKDAFTKLSELQIGSRPLIKQLLGSVTEFGSWTVVFMATIMFFVTIIVGFIEKVKLNDFIDNFVNGTKKIYKVAFIYVLINCCYILLYYFPYALTIINSMLGESFNFLTMFFVGVVGLFFAVEYELIGNTLGAYLATIYPEKLAEVAFVLHLGMSFATILIPTSALLMVLLSYLDVPYKNWLSYIWKFALSLFISLLIIILIMVAL